MIIVLIFSSFVQANVLGSDTPLSPVLIQQSSEAFDRSSRITAPSDVIRPDRVAPDQLKDLGLDYSSGSTYFLLVCSFIEGQLGTGKLWVVPNNPLQASQGYELIKGLDRPTGSCVDVNHNFLYVVDNGFGRVGSIYQYEITWSSSHFALSRNAYVIVYRGLQPYDCKVDSYGNLIFLEAEYNEIGLISYLDLYSGFTNMNFTLYSDPNFISHPVALEVFNSEDIFYVNLNDGDTVGSLNRADSLVRFVNGGKIDRLVVNKTRTWGVAHSPYGILYYVNDEGEMWSLVNMMNVVNETRQIKNSGLMEKPRGMCYGELFVYVTDFGTGKVWRFSDNPYLEEPQLLIKIPGAYSVFCANGGLWLAIAALGYFL